MSKPAKVINGKIEIPDELEDIETWSPTGHLRFKDKIVSGVTKSLLQQEWATWPTQKKQWREIPWVRLGDKDDE